MTTSFATKIGRIGVAAGVLALGVAVKASPAAADTPRSCTTAGSGYYCYWAQNYGGGSVYEDASCYGHVGHSYPQWLWDKVHSWTNMQVGRRPPVGDVLQDQAIIENFDWQDGVDVYVSDESAGQYNWTGYLRNADNFVNYAPC